MSKPVEHLLVSLVSLIGGYAAAVCLGFIVWVIVGDNPSSDNPVLLVYQVLFWITPMVALVYFNLRVHRKEPNKAPQHNAGIGPAILDGAPPPRPASSSEETARPQSPRG